MTVRWTATALAEVEQVLSYIAVDNPTAAEAITDEIDAVVLRITDYPKFARVVYKGDVRAVMVGRFDYRRFYVVHGQELMIRNVRSTRRAALGK